MSLSRYRNSYLIDGYKLSIPNIKFTYANEDIYFYSTKKSDRVDKMAMEDFGSEEYWWILAKLNNISFFFDIVNIETIKRVRNPQVFLEQI